MIAQLTNHLWQSTVFAAVAALLTHALRRHRAHLRYWVWFAASVKFLVPFTLLIAVGALAPWRLARPIAPSTPLPAFSVAVDQIAQPFPTAASIAVTTAPRRIEWGLIVFSIWLLACAAIVIVRLRGWRQIRRAVRASAPLTLSAGPPALEVRSAPGMLEPGVIGIRRPILLLPERITECLTPVQLEAVVVHEQCHVQRRDNLTAAVHMLVEAVFWFHPLVWWIGPRLVAERERACDEAVLGTGIDAGVYATALVNVCKLYVSSPLACVAGVTGADLKDRIRAILASRAPRDLGPMKKAMLALAATTVVMTPVAAGVLAAPLRQADRSGAVQAVPQGPQTFDVISVRPCDPSEDVANNRGGIRHINTSRNRLSLDCATPEALINMAYARDGAFRLTEDLARQVRGGPDWLRSDRYSIDATTTGDPNQSAMLGPMLRTLLESRFHLRTHRGVEQVPMYALTVAKDGLKIKPASGDDCTPDESEAPTPAAGGSAPTAGKAKKPTCGMTSGRRRGSLRIWELAGSSFHELASVLETDREVIDQTGVTDRFNIHLEYTLEPGAQGAATAAPDRPDNSGPNVFAALEHQLGLRLVPTKGPHEYVVIDHVERPTPNDGGGAIQAARVPGAGK